MASELCYQGVYASEVCRNPWIVCLTKLAILMSWQARETPTCSMYLIRHGLAQLSSAWLGLTDYGTRVHVSLVRQGRRMLI